MRQTTNNVLYSWKMVLVFALRGAHMHTLTANGMVLERIAYMEGCMCAANFSIAGC